MFVLCIAMQDMSAEVVDSNPYSRLMALQRMGIVENYERIRDFSVAIVVSTKYQTFLFSIYVFVIVAGSCLSLCSL